jgi:Ni/Fe-hydrogenase subunit HybB-like protein
MVEKALSGSKWYWGWIVFLLAIMGLGLAFYFLDADVDLSNDVPWGILIGQYAFFVGVAASAVMVVLPYYLHNYTVFRKMIIFGEFLAVVAVMMTGLFILADMGQPTRFFNLFLYPSPSSVLFWTSSALIIYMGLNILIGWTVLKAERETVDPPAWIKPFIYLSIPWAFSLHTTTAFVFAGLPGRPFWLSAITAARFLASAFASGPALLIILCLIIKRLARFDVGKEALQTLAKIVTYAMIASVFFFGLELFTAFYSQIPAHMFSFQYLFFGYEGNGKLVAVMWVSYLLAGLALTLLIIPRTRKVEGTLMVGCLAVFISILIEKGFGLVVGGLVPNPFGKVTEYWPTLPEVMVNTGIWATGALILTLLYKIVVAVREEIE